MKCPDLHRKVILPNTPSWGVGVVGGVNLKQTSLLGIVRHVQICTENHVCHTPPLMGWRCQITKQNCYK